MRVLLTALVPSHLMPMVPLAWGLRAAGHDVLVCGMPEVVAAAREAGLLTRPIGPEENETARLARPGAIARPAVTGPGAPGEGHWERAGRRWEKRLRGYLDGFLALARDVRPDLVVTDPVEFGGLIVGEALGVPTAVHRWGPDTVTTVLHERAKTALAGLCAEYGVDAFPDPGVIIDPCPPSLRDPGAAPARSVRFVPYNGTGVLPPWTLEPRTAPRVCICLGMWGSQAVGQDGDRAAVVRAVGEAVAAAGATAVLPFPAERHGDLGDVPAAVDVIDRTPVGLLAGACDLMVHHGGGGLTLTALHHGLPQLVVPQDEPFLGATAELVEDRGLGLAIGDPGARRDPEAIGKALTRLLEDPGHRQAAARIAGEMTGLPSPAALVSLLEETAG
ncbi:nucleotide disphospho-sugar-binding domain-containing protein [Actinomadura montaniterrae]|uniref:DUF1205 domain-containing protein n=1 Tax=Actinomadura montaniterrae TaxID=1803903 RepID=A0A6L3VZI5_9ACTN|nr:nucleotide disphospho-sugar-binding domain-containing protein [Actinomadura montaniterrae]KAB2381569.1 DUF1205 domain-containing protein [Actinomadura montaniterrae]